MKVGVLSYDYVPAIGGLGATVHRLVTAMRSEGSILRTITPSSASDIPVPWYARFRFGKAGGCPLFSLGISFVLRSILEREKVDLLHVHAGSGGACILWKLPVNVLVTAHHTYRQEATMFRSLGQPLRAWKKYLMSFLEARTYRLADAITCVSEDTKQNLIEDYGIPAESITVIENPVDAEQSPGKSPLPTLSQLLFVGRLEERKGIFVLLDALKLLKSTFPSLRLLCLGSDLLSGEVQRWSERHHLQESIELRGHVCDTEYHEILADASLVVVPSYLEGFGLVAAEAMLRGACVIASDCPGLRSILRHQQTGMLFRTGDSEDCARVIRLALENPTLQQEIGSRAREEAKERFDAQRIARQYLRTYDHCSR